MQQEHHERNDAERAKVRSTKSLVYPSESMSRIIVDNLHQDVRYMVSV